MKQVVIEHKEKVWDTATIISGGIYTAISDALPLLIGIATVVLLAYRIMATRKENKLKDLEIALKTQELEHEIHRPKE